MLLALVRGLLAVSFVVLQLLALVLLALAARFVDASDDEMVQRRANADVRAFILIIAVEC